MVFQRKLLILCSVLFVICCDRKQEKRSNELINETSPYLLQHAHNPVDWKAWNDNSLALAKKENKLMIISIGYSACHWCHVMEEESFANDTIAKIMNENFINIKVDREERPDIDKIYMDAVQLMTGTGGWPLNCITLPNGKPIFGGTYFTNKQWEKILLDISDLYKNNPQKANEYADRLTKGLQESNLITLNNEKVNFKKEEIQTAIQKSKDILDTKFGGLKGAIKFPMPNTLDYLLRYHHQFGDSEIEDYIHLTLRKMAYGGIYDQIGGGFSRYSVDEKWHIPHFEKMLYDNAQLVSVYSKAYMTKNDDLYKQIIYQTLDFISSELTLPNGAFYSSIDADSKNNENQSEEGIYYTWTKKELQSLLSEEDFRLLQQYYNVNDFGYWENNQYIFIRNQSDDKFAAENNLSKKQLQSKIKIWKSLLIKARNKRKKPNTDDKVLTSWNALMLQAYIDAYKAFGEKYFLDTAIRNAHFIIENQFQKNGGLYRNYKNGKSTINAYAEDFATVIQVFISLYEVTFDIQYLIKAKELMNYTLVHFYDINSGMFFYTSDLDNNLITRKIDVLDGVISSSNAMLAQSLIKLSHFDYNTKYKETAIQMLKNMKSDIYSSPLSYSYWLQSITNETNPFYEIALVGDNVVDMHQELNHKYLPNIIVAGSVKETISPLLLKNKYVDDNTLMYVCINGTCKLPQSDVYKGLELIKR